MSKIYKGKSKLKKDKEKYFFITGAFLGIILLSALLLYTGYIKAYIFIIILIIAATLTNVNLKKYRVIKAGVKGETAVQKLLKTLPDNYVVFNNLLIPGNRGRKELDLLAVGDNGLFIVEVKNHKGIITGNKESRTLIQNKTGKNGGKYSKEIDNPLFQLREQISAVAFLLKNNKFNGNLVDGLVYFSNVESKVELDKSAYEITDDEKAVIRFITSSKRNHLSKDEKDGIITLLKRYLQ